MNRQKGSTMGCQDGSAAIRHSLYETAGWPAEAGDSFFMPGQLVSEEPTAAAELKIKFVPIQDGEAVKGTVIRQMVYETAGWPAEAGDSFFMPGQLVSEEPTAAAELKILLVAIQDGEPVMGVVPPGRPGTAA
jgi:hypothetical protein